MAVDGEKLVTAEQVEDFLKSKKKTRFWFHNLGGRHGLLPPPIVRTNYKYTNRKLKKILPERAQKKLKKLKGRSVYYPAEIIAYLELIIELKDIKDLSFGEITKDENILRELNKLKYLVSTSLFVNAFKRDEGFFINFRVAMKILSERYGVGGDGALGEMLGRVLEEAQRNYRKYFEINEKIRGHAIRYEVVDKELEKEKTMLAYSVTLGLKMMDATTKTVFEALKKKEISQIEWLKVAKEIENEDRSAGIIR
jgi:hypothetical protein